MSVLKKILEKPFILVLFSAILLSLPWLSPLSPSIFVGFVPLLLLWKRNQRHFLLWTAICMLLWMSFTCWWVSIATAAAFVGIPLFGMIYSWGPISIWYKLQKNVSEPIRWILFISLYLIAEGLYTYAEFSFPWLTLGNAFARTPVLVQWYEWTGVFGGSFWALLMNVLVFKVISQKQCVKALIATTMIPVVCSLYLYFTYSPGGEEKKITVIQPNLNPYEEKYNGLSVDKQVDLILNLADSTEEPDYYIAPETAIDDYMWTNLLSENSNVFKIREFVRSKSYNPVMIIGATTVSQVSPSRAYDYAVHKTGNVYYIGYNSALWIDSTANVDCYHKGCLVVGAEKLPYPKFFRAVERAIGVKFAGIFGNYGRSEKREVYHGIGTAICYESVYSEYFTGYIKEGAQLMAVITNDGWWNDTPGYMQHLSYSRLRAIETRRSIARSANTGISAFINGRGDIVESMGWDQRGAIYGKLFTDNRKTLYVRLGDWPVRLSWYMMIVCIGYILALKFRKKF